MPVLSTQAASWLGTPCDEPPGRYPSGTNHVFLPPTWPPVVGGAGRQARHLPSVDLEVELVDVSLVEHERRTQQDALLGPHLVAAELARGEPLARLARDGTGRVVHGRVRSQVAEVRGVPELERDDRPVLDVLPQRVGRTQPGQPHLPAVARG